MQRGERGQVVKAVDCGSTTRGFESRRSPSSQIATEIAPYHGWGLLIFNGATGDLLLQICVGRFRSSDRMSPTNAIAFAHRSETRLQLGDLKGAEDDLNRFSGLIMNECDRSPD
jgi:hypothetical protein